jgi:dihydroorotate dehydrogenase
MMINGAGVAEIYPSRHREPGRKLATLYRHPATAAVVLKTCTQEPRVGAPRAWAVGRDQSVNKVRLDNPGTEATAARVRRLLQDVAWNGKPVIVSFWAPGPDTAVATLRGLEQALGPAVEPVWFEWNVSCPNAPAVAADLACTWRRLVSLTRRPVGLKVGADTPLVPAPLPFVTAVNTLCGHGGRGLRQVALQAIRRWRGHLGTGATVIGMGGCRGADDVAAYLAAGATWVGVATALLQDGLAALVTTPVSNTAELIPSRL